VAPILESAATEDKGKIREEGFFLKTLVKEISGFGEDWGGNRGDCGGAGGFRIVADLKQREEAHVSDNGNVN